MKKTGALSVMAILMYGSAIYGATLTVDVNGGADFTSIQGAIDAANTGDEIQVAAGTYYEAIDFKDKAVRLYSSDGPEVTTIHGYLGQTFEENFDDGNYTGWEIKDEGNIAGPSSWSAASGVMVQSSNIYYELTTESRYRGTYALCKHEIPWTDYEVTLSMKSLDDDWVGVMFRYQDPSNYYRFAWNGTQGTSGQLVKMEGGAVTTLEEYDGVYAEDQWYQVRIAVTTDRIRVFIDDVQICDVQDSSFSSGPIALYCWGNEGAYFDNIEVNFTAYHVVQCVLGEGANTVLEGFTITGGNASGPTFPELNCGGGMYNSASSPTVNNCIFRDNSALINGGGMFNITDSSPTVTNCTFSGNSAQNSGGGMFNLGNSSPTVANCIFSGNSAVGGAGMWNHASSSPIVTNCTFSGNMASESGGGLYNADSNPTLTNCVISGNQANSDGGGMFNSSSDPSVTNCKLTGNTAGVNGGGIYNYADSSPMVINCTFTGNIAVDGGGVYNLDNCNPTLTNCILWGDAPDEILDVSSTTTVTYSDIQGGWTGTGNIDVDPQLMPMGPVGGNLLPRSAQCIDAGNNADVPSGVTMDLGGRARFVDDPDIADTGVGTAPIVDMGAYERQPEDIFRTITVDDNGPADFDRIQDAIYSSENGDYIQVAPGVYRETINFRGKAIRLYSSHGPAATIINGDGEGHVVQCVTDEGLSTILEGFTITGGNATEGGGMYISNASPTVTSCVFIGNRAHQGGAMAIRGVSQSKVDNCVFTRNFARVGGGAVYTWSGGYTSDSWLNCRPLLTNCTFNNNTAAYGGAMYNPGSYPTATNCIFWGNKPDEILGDTTTVTYSNVKGGWLGTGTGNINADPLFDLSGELHLPLGSPCIDAGINTPQGGLAAADIDGMERILDGDDDGTATVDMGAYEFNPDPLSPTRMVVWPPVIEFLAYGGQVPEPELVEIKNIGSGTLNWQIDVDGAWLDLNRTGGESSGETDNVILDPDISSLAPGLYHCTLTISDPGAINSPVVVSATLKVGCIRNVPDEYSTIQAAIDASNDGDIVLVADSTYEEHDLEFGGRAIIVKSENGPENCIIDCKELGRGFYFDNSGETSDSMLDGFTILNGSALEKHGSPTYQQGGGIYVSGASPTIQNCRFQSCTASNGGAAYMRDSIAILNDCDFSENEASGKGGAILNHTNGNPTVIKCRFTANTADDGGAMYCENGSNPNILDCTFSDNSAANGGAIYNNSSNPSLTACTFTINKATGGGGGFFNTASSPTVIRCNFIGNTAAGGGGMCNTNISNPMVTSCTFSENTVSGSTSGAGMYNYNYSSPVLTNCTFWANKATGYNGGGMRNYHYSSPILTNCTFAENTAPQGSVMYNTSDSSPILTNCVVWDRTPSANSISPNTAMVTYSDVQGGHNGIGNIDSDPLFADVDEGDLRLQVMSPCIDVGRNIDGMYSDIRGSVRPIDVVDAGQPWNNNFDMGAYEYSDYYSGAEDGTVPAFRDVGMPAFCLVGEAAEIRWKNHAGFPDDDRRIHLPAEYQVNLVLISEDRTQQIKLNSQPITVPSTTAAAEIPYSQEYTFRTIHAGRWYLRVELSEDTNQYVESTQTFLVSLRQPTLFEIGTEITPPFNVDLTVDPKVEEGREDYFYWSEYARKLYAIGPIAAVIEWTDSYGDPLPILVGNVWPGDMQIHIADSPDVELLPEASPFSFVEARYADNDATVNGSMFSATSEGRCILMYGENSNYEFVPQFEVVRTVLWNNPEFLEEAEWPIGTEVTEPGHDADCGSGHVYQEVSPYDADVYDRDARTGQIFAVNTDDPSSVADDLIVFWYEKGQFGGNWPYLPMRYDPRWPTPDDGLERIVIGSCLGSDVYDQDPLDDSHRNMQIYNQPDPALPGCNPNEEHAAFFKSNLGYTHSAVFALRNDLNRTDWEGPSYTSEPYVLLKYQDIYDMWHYRVFQVLLEADPVDVYPGYNLRYENIVGTRMEPPYPLNLMFMCDGESYADMPGPWWTDYNSRIWARHAGLNHEDTVMGTLRWFYPLQAEFYYDLDGDGVQDEAVDTCLPWLDRNASTAPGTPIAVAYDLSWPSDVPQLQVGETLMKPKRGLPNIMNQCSVEIIYDEPNEISELGRAVKLMSPLSEHRVECPVENLSGIRVRYKTGVQVFDDLPFHLRMRCYYDPVNQELVFKGHFDDTVAGEPILLLNVVSDRERDKLLDLDGTGDTGSEWDEAVQELYEETQRALDENQTKVIGGTNALSAGSAAEVGYVTLVFAGDENCSPLPISVEVIEVVCGPYRGDIKVIESDNVFDERITFKHSGDFGGRPEGRTFQWAYSDSLTKPSHPDPTMGVPQDTWRYWLEFEPPEGNGETYITIGGTGVQALEDMWFSCRYFDELCGEWSLWTEPQLHESWVKRVMRQVNVFDQRFKDFHKSEINTLVSMVGQIGRRYEGDVALNADPANMNSIGMLEFYETLFRRTEELSSIDQDDPGELAQRTLLFANSRIASLYTLLGNEAYADALDPTIGFTTEGVEYGVMAPSIHCFQNQTDSLLSEELALLRGVESDPYPQPLYNRLVWNFTSGDGEVAYASSYVITDMDDDGDIDEYDAAIMYPQGHGDAWGHYLMALKTYYRLLVHPNYTWVPQSEYVLVAGIPVEVDYFDERQFAKIAAAKARTSVEIVNLTYRQRFDEDPENQWQGYKDTDSSRAWGVSGWASRAGQGAYFDWVVANALLPDVDTDPNHTGLQKVDRTTVIEIRNITGSFNEIQAKLDMADLGLNPLGIAKDVIPFDINPFELVDALGQPSGRTHFEQIYDRAAIALNNVQKAFDFANQNTQLLRRQQDSLEDFIYNVAQRELDFKNRLVEIFGYPYDDDIGPTGTYPEGYQGPDIYHFMYVDPSELMNANSSGTTKFTLTLKEPHVDSKGALSYESKDVEFNLSQNGLGLIKPASWTGTRRAPGELQMARSELLQVKTNMERALLDYDNLVKQIDDQAQMLEAQYNLDSTELYILDKTHNTQQSLDKAILASRAIQLGFRALGRRAIIIADAMAEFLPTSVGFSSDITSGARGGIKLAGAIGNEIVSEIADVASIGELMAQQAKERAQSLSNIELTAARHDLAELQQFKQLELLVRSEALQRLGLFTLAETMQQASGRYLAALARGERLYEELTSFRKRTAAGIQHYRYNDMTFRVFRNDALQKYRAQFDLAAMYAYLAAKAYDYETALLDDYSEAGQHFLNRIARQRTIGQISQNTPIPGDGLAGVLAELKQNYDVFKTTMGFNNPQIETTWFSLREENFRITKNTASNVDWQKELDRYYVEDLWDLPEFRRYCKPFDTEEVALPGFVIPFQTNITNGLNLFGWPGGADPFYAAENFVTKIRSVGVWFSNYDTSIMSSTPRVYLIPVGQDVVRADIGEIRSWQVVEQSIPLPFQIGEYELANNFEWIPINDSVPGPLAKIRRYTRFRAYPDGGFNPSEMTYDSRLIGRSVWNTRWLLIIPGHSLYLSDPWEGIERFIQGATVPGSEDERTGNGVTDIKLFFKTYAFPGY